MWKLGCARIGCPFWLSEKSPSIEIADGLMNLWLITMDMGLCCVWRVPPLAPAPPNYIQPHPIPQHVHVLSPHHEHPATPLPLPYYTTPGTVSNANNTSTILAKCLAEHCASPENDTQRWGGGGGGGGEPM